MLPIMMIMDCKASPNYRFYFIRVAIVMVSPYSNRTLPKTLGNG